MRLNSSGWSSPSSSKVPDKSPSLSQPAATEPVARFANTALRDLRTQQRGPLRGSFAAVSAVTDVATSAEVPRSNRKALLALGALGVVFGDIGTSPLYAFQEIFDGVHDIPAVEHRVYGAASMVFWTLTLIVSIKYVLIVMRADNDGEGGIMALASLAVSKVKHRRKLIMGLGILGAALFYGDGMITPPFPCCRPLKGLSSLIRG